MTATKEDRAKAAAAAQGWMIDMPFMSVDHKTLLALLMGVYLDGMLAEREQLDLSSPKVA